MTEYGYGENQKNNWYITGRTPSNSMYVPLNFDLNRNLGYDPISKDTPEAMVNGTVYMSGTGILKAMDLGTLKTKWQYNVAGPYSDFIGIAVRDQLVFTMRPYNLSVIEDMGSTFRIIWDEKSEGGFNNITFDDRNLYYTLYTPETSTAPESSKLMARNALTGQLLWSYTPDMDTGKLLTGANLLFMGGKKNTGLETKAAAINSLSGDVVWEKTVSSSGFSYRIVYSDGVLYFPIQQNEGSEIYALDANTGNTLWKYTYPYNFHITNFDAISVNHDIVLFLDNIDNMVALDNKSGALKWKTTYGDGNSYFPKYDTVQRPILTDDQIFIDKNNKIKVFQATSGALLREYQPYQLVLNGKPPYLLIMLNADRMVVESYDGVYYSVSANALPKFRYTIQPGDTLSKIALRFNTTVRYLVLLNNLDVNALIYIGQSILVPQMTDTSYVYYITKPGDTLYTIAQAYNTTINAIASLNNITNVNNIYIGQILKIPVYTVHTVMPGETLLIIAAKYNVSVQEIIQKNGITNPNLIYAGQKLLIK